VYLDNGLRTPGVKKISRSCPSKRRLLQNYVIPAIFHYDKKLSPVEAGGAGPQQIHYNPQNLLFLDLIDNNSHYRKF
jgi:hypothetical protein